MRKIDTYIFKQIAVGVIFVTISLVAVIWLTQSLRFIQLVLGKGLTIATFMRLTLLLLPGFLTIILPISLFSVVMFVYNRLETDRELAVMRAAGLSNKSLAYPAIILAIATTLFCYYLSLVTVPKSVTAFREMQWTIRHDVSHLLLQEGEFNNIAKDITVYIKERKQNGELTGILVHDKRNPKKKITLMADKGKLIYANDHPRIVMQNGNQQEVSENNSRLSVLYFDEYTFDFGIINEDSGIRFRDARERPIGELFNAEKIKRISDKDIGRFTVEAHKRLTIPLYNIALTLVALCGLLSNKFARRGQSKRLFLVATIMVLIEALALGAESIAAKNLNMIPLIYLNALLPILICTYILFIKDNLNKKRTLESAS